MTAAYAAMAALCAVETFGFLVHDGRFLAMGLEYFAYLAILLFLYRARLAQPARSPSSELHDDVAHAAALHRLVRLGDAVEREGGAEIGL